MVSVPFNYSNPALMVGAGGFLWLNTDSVSSAIKPHESRFWYPVDEGWAYRYRAWTQADYDKSDGQVIGKNNYGWPFLAYFDLGLPDDNGNWGNHWHKWGLFADGSIALTSLAIFALLSEYIFYRRFRHNTAGTSDRSDFSYRICLAGAIVSKPTKSGREEK